MPDRQKKPQRDDVPGHFRSRLHDSASHFITSTHGKPMKITVSGSVGLYVDNDDQDPVHDSAVLRRFDGIHSPQEEDDAFANYIDDANLRSIGIKGGFIELRYDAAVNALSVVTEYDSPRPLNDEELRELVEHTTDQWSDGLGESFECSEAESNGLELDLAPPGQRVQVQQQ
ncbi:hypothetical protein Mal4_25480 [Maioricimonas rarisocia]|uniref:Uncharacterized protein n=1 Tax=Maioricimonas rarisocia TaxID=2528026 RepID=A0A517Z6W3_9PLAN|nr:hypothetical protein [Maioricimonas rarisocia]QDU38223.1 hypothetical protein Mal4_25480 [Maioricimonas rarisocia]